MNEPSSASPGVRPPPLRTINGIGLRLLGHRDDDPNGSYVATLHFTFLFIPVFKICGYRVKDAGKNAWYFYSREPLTGADKVFNVLVSPFLAAAIIWLVRYVGLKGH